MTARTAACLLITSIAGFAQDPSDWERLLKGATFGLGDAISKGMKDAGEGVVMHAELELDRGVAVYSIDVAQGTKTFNVVYDAKDGRVVEKVVEKDDRSALVQASRIALPAAIATALTKSPGTPVEAQARLKDGKAVIVVKVFRDGKLTTVDVDGVSGEVLVAELEIPRKEKAEKAFTDTFLVEDGDWSSTGSNPFFILEPGYVLVLEGKDEGQDARLTITVLPETRTVAGVETRVVEEREEVGGKLIEVSRNFFAISKKTSSVYYFGEEVDIYEDGKIASHEGAWLSGKSGARFGLMMPGTPLIGARYYQEIAPGVAMDRAQIESLGETLETPAGRFEKCLKVEESTPLEKGKESKLYAPGIGLIQDGDLRLARHGRPKGGTTGTIQAESVGAHMIPARPS
jgi:uncharacterized membrane protein YkoI